MIKLLTLIIVIAIFSSCTKTHPEPQCYTCTFGTIKVGTQSWHPNDEVHCEQGAANYKKYLTVPGTIINKWQYPSSCILK